MVSVDARREGNTPTARQIDSQAPDAGPHGFTTDASRVPSVPPKRWRPLAHREILAWTVAALTGAAIAATITVTGLTAAKTDGNAALPRVRVAGVAALPASPTSGLGPSDPREPASAATAIPLAALPRDPPAKASAAKPPPAAGARMKIAAKAKATAATKKKTTTTQGEKTTLAAKGASSAKARKSTE